MLIQLVAARCRPCFIFTECEVNVKCIKTHELLSIFCVTLQCLLPRDVVEHSCSLPIFAVSVSRYFRKKSRLCRHSRMCVCNFRTSYDVFSLNFVRTSRHCRLYPLFLSVNLPAVKTRLSDTSWGNTIMGV